MMRTLLFSMIHDKDGIVTVACLIALEVFIRIGTVWAGICTSYKTNQTTRTQHDCVICFWIVCTAA